MRYIRNQCDDRVPSVQCSLLLEPIAYCEYHRSLKSLLESDLHITDGATAGRWIQNKLNPGFGARVSQLVPPEYEAYARILHPAFDDAGNAVTWAEVAQEMGRHTHATMQWRSLAHATDSLALSDWRGNDPATGELVQPFLDDLCKILANHTSDTELCFFGLSTIRGSVTHTVSKPLLRLPQRDFVILAGPLSAINQLGTDAPQWESALMVSEKEVHRHRRESKLHLPQSPNLLWPDDHSWCVASEYDFDSTIVGGDRQLISEIVDGAVLEAWPIGPDDSLQFDADAINTIGDTKDGRP